MAHEIELNKATGKAEMAYVGNRPWHGLGQEVTQGASIEVWQREAGLNWEAREATAQFVNEDGLLLPMNSRKVIYRSDNSQPVGMVSDKYKVVQPLELLELFRDLTESGGWHIHTAGALRSGSKIWVMASPTKGMNATVGKHDRVKGNLLLATSLDGSIKTTGKLISTRAVCANTLAIAMGEGGNQVTIGHRSWFNADDIKDALGVSVGAFDQFMTQANKLADQPISVAEAREVLREIFGQPTTSGIKETSSDFEFQQLMAQFVMPGMKEKEQRSVSRVLSLFEGEGMGSHLQGAVGTRWGLLNACSQHVDYEKGRTIDTRTESAWFGQGDEMKRKALDILVAL